MTAWRSQALGLSAVCFVAAAVNGYLAGGDLLHLLRGFAERRPVISSAHFTVAGLLLTPVGISVGVLFLFAEPATPEQMKNASRRSVRWTSRYARDITELRRVYPDIPNSQLQALIRANKTSYPQSFGK